MSIRHFTRNLSCVVATLVSLAMIYMTGCQDGDTTGGAYQAKIIAPLGSYIGATAPENFIVEFPSGIPGSFTFSLNNSNVTSFFELKPSFNQATAKGVDIAQFLISGQNTFKASPYVNIQFTIDDIGPDVHIMGATNPNPTTVDIQGYLVDDSEVQALDINSQTIALEVDDSFDTTVVEASSFDLESMDFNGATNTTTVLRTGEFVSNAFDVHISAGGISHFNHAIAEIFENSNADRLAQLGLPASPIFISNGVDIFLVGLNGSGVDVSIGLSGASAELPVTVDIISLEYQLSVTVDGSSYDATLTVNNFFHDSDASPTLSGSNLAVTTSTNSLSSTFLDIDVSSLPGSALTTINDNEIAIASALDQTFANQLTGGAIRYMIDSLATPSFSDGVGITVTPEYHSFVVNSNGISLGNNIATVNPVEAGVNETLGSRYIDLLSASAGTPTIGFTGLLTVNHLNQRMLAGHNAGFLVVSEDVDLPGEGTLRYTLEPKSAAFIELNSGASGPILNIEDMQATIQFRDINESTFETAYTSLIDLQMNVVLQPDSEQQISVRKPLPRPILTYRKTELTPLPAYTITQIYAEGRFRSTLQSSTSALVAPLNDIVFAGGAMKVSNITIPEDGYLKISGDICSVSGICENNHNVGGLLSGATDTVWLQLNGAETLVLNNGNFSFSTKLPEGANYDAVVAWTPLGQGCSVNNGSGIVGTSDITDIVVECGSSTFSIGGLANNVFSSVTLNLNNGMEELTIGNGSFSFVSKLAPNDIYNITIPENPVGQTCTVISGLGFATADITDVAVNCADIGIHSIGGNVTGLEGSISLRINTGETIVVTSNTSFSFPTLLTQGEAYTILVTEEPIGQDCDISNGTSNANSDVTNVLVSCSTNYYSIGGNYIDLNGTASLLLNNSEPLNVNGSGNGSFNFTTQFVYGDIYTVTLESQPVGQQCTLTSGTGTVTNEVDNLVINCITNTYSVGGGVTGLNGELTVTLGSQSLAINSDGGFSFLTPLDHGSNYNVVVSQQPVGQQCVVSGGDNGNGGGVIVDVVTDISVTCTTNTYSIGGAVSGLTGTAMLRLDNGETLEVLSSASNYNFQSLLDHGTAYSVQIETPPIGQTCNLINTSGAATSNVSNINLSCITNTYSITGSVTGSTGITTLRLNGGNDINISGNNSFTFGNELNYGTSYTVSIHSAPTGQTCTAVNSSGTATNDINNIQITCTTNTYQIGGNVTNLTGNVVLRINGNGTQTINISANGSFNFPTQLSHGTNYVVDIATQPTGYTCNVIDGTGTATSTVSNIAVNCTINQYTIGGTIYGLTGTVLLDINGAEVISRSNNGDFSFVNQLDYASTYNVNISANPLGQTCNLSAGSGTVSGTVSNITVTCTTIDYNVSGNLAGLNGGNSLSLQINNAEQLTLTNNGGFSFTTDLHYNNTYTVLITASPIGQTCGITNGSGTVTNQVDDLHINCITNTYSVGGNVNGLTSSMVLTLNEGQHLTIDSDGGFSFPNPLTHGSSYLVEVETQPLGQTCNVNFGDGTITSNIGNVDVICETNTYLIGGEATGLTGTATLDINGAETLDVTEDGNFEFPSELSYGLTYTVTIDSNPTGQTCTINNGTGAATADISDIELDCSTNTYTIGGSVTGSTGSLTLIINNIDTIIVNGDNSFTFPNTLSHGTAYDVDIETDPTGQSCSVINGTGTAISNVATISVTCTTNDYSVGGSILGLNGNIVLSLNGSETLSRSSDGIFTFSTSIDHGNSYLVTIDSQPIGQTCDISNASGAMSGEVINIDVNCETNSYTIGGNTFGLNGTVVLLLNGGNSINVSTSSFNFGSNAAIDHGDTYSVTIGSQPTGQDCVVVNSGGTAVGNISSVSVNCTTLSYSVGGTITGVSGTVTLQITGGQTVTSGNGSFTFGSPLSHGTIYTASITAQPAVQSCEINNASGTITDPVNNILVSCVTNTFTVGGTVSGISGNIDLQLNGGEIISQASDGSFTFGTELITGSSYDVTVANPPVGQSCNVDDGSGNSTIDVTNVSISCQDLQFTIGGNAAGIVGSLQLDINGGASLNVTTDGSFTFVGTRSYGTTYSVTIGSSPAGQNCLLNNASGTQYDNISDITAVCTSIQYSISGSVSGLTGTVELALNGGEVIQVNGNNGFNFTTTLTYNAAYNVSIATQPDDEDCVVNDGSGNITGNVSNISVNCSSTAAWYTISHNYSGECLQRIGTNIEAQPCNSGNMDQRWLISIGPGHGTQYTHITIQSVSTPSECVMENNLAISSSTCNGGNAQIWWLQGSANNLRIRIEDRNHCMAAGYYGGNVTAISSIWDCDWGLSDSVKWSIYLNGQGSAVSF